MTCVPGLPEAKKDVRVTICLTRALSERVSRAAAYAGASRSEFVEGVLARECEEGGPLSATPRSRRPSGGAMRGATGWGSSDGMASVRMVRAVFFARVLRGSVYLDGKQEEDGDA